MLEATRYVDLVIPQLYGMDKVHDIHLFKINTCVMGDDWSGKFDFFKEFCDVLYLPRTTAGMREFSTTKFKEELQKLDFTI